MQTFTLWKENKKRRTKMGFIAGYWCAIRRAKELSLLTSRRILVVTQKKIKAIVVGGKLG